MQTKTTGRFDGTAGRFTAVVGAILICVLTLPASADPPARYHVDDGPLGDNANDGMSWDTPKKTIKGALDAGAGDGSEIWVKAGTYHPEEVYGIRIFSRSVHIYGGFPNTANPTMADRDWKANETIIDGQNDRGHCIYIRTGSPVVDGFTLTRGNPASQGLQDGAGIEIGNGSAAVIRHCIIKNNTASGTGGGLLIRDNGTNPTIVNCMITGNSASQGGAILFYLCNGTPPKLINCTITGNTTTDANPGTGTVESNSSHVDITNTIIYGNTLAGSNPEIEIPPVFWVVNVNYSAVDQTGLPGTGNLLEVDPGFVGGGDYHLGAGSQCIDAGNNTAAAGVTTDFEGDARIINGGNGATVDMGADEYSGPGTSITPGPHDPLTVTQSGNAFIEVDAATDFYESPEDVGAHVGANVLATGHNYSLATPETTETGEVIGEGSLPFSVNTDKTMYFTVKVHGVLVTHGFAEALIEVDAAIKEVNTGAVIKTFTKHESRFGNTPPGFNQVDEETPPDDSWTAVAGVDYVLEFRQRLYATATGRGSSA